ncbi:MAG: anthranilate synthase component I family protein [Bacteroidales bacterium]|jgi:para-aminobenzoate synthetase component 1|nr:anthranilate synthase component I family protein [Bacteroidales bacterium]
MVDQFQVNIKDPEKFKQQLMLWGNQFEPFVFLDSGNYNQHPTSNNSYGEYDFLAAVNAHKTCCPTSDNKLEKLKHFVQENRQWIFGYFSYDLKNEVEKMESNNTDNLRFPELHFFIPGLVFTSRNNKITLYYPQEKYTHKELKQIIREIESTHPSPFTERTLNIHMKPRFSKDEYLDTVVKLKQHIQRGDIYEVNFCQEFYSNSTIDPLSTWLSLREVSPTPFSCFYKTGTHFLLSASPERFLKKKNNKIIAQPIKGTIRRGTSEKEDLHLKDKLFNDPKERAENVMIVDLVRNDLSRTAKKGTVHVEELYGIYSFKQVHQMISTVVSEVEPGISVIDIIKNAFPMGSMTGAPKVRAMELIEHYEKTKRGLYSGAVGYISPDRDFDFNVVIRSILYNASKNYVSFTVGGAITSLSVPEQEYQECMVKAQAMFNVLNNA